MSCSRLMPTLSAFWILLSEIAAEISHIEHHLTHLGDLISIAERSRTGGIDIGGGHVSKEKLEEVHRGLIEQIASTVRWGYQAARKNGEGEIVAEAQIGRPSRSIVDIGGHRKFIEAVFGTSRAGLDFVRTPVEVFHHQLRFITRRRPRVSRNRVPRWIYWRRASHSGMLGITESQPGTRAVVSKLHGSIDWYRPHSGTANLLRVRHGDTYPGSGGTVMIYPQATKYLNTQRDPFAEIFQRFRQRLSHGSDHVLLVCGYSFGDEHINAEIEIAMSSLRNQLTVIAFNDEPNGELPKTLREWQSKIWSQRLFIASPKGIYQGSLGPVFPLEEGNRDWWTFDGAATASCQWSSKGHSGGNGMSAFSPRYRLGNWHSLRGCWQCHKNRA